MKVEVDNKPCFKPFTITITVESEEELLDLHARLNVAPCVINDNLPAPRGWADGHSSSVLFDEIDDKAKELGLKR